MNRIQVLVIALAASFGFAAGAAQAAEPTLHEVYQAVQTGQLKQAEGMMEQVLRDHPDSAKAHFVEAEIQAKEGNTSKARAELASAERLAPGLPFAKPEAVAELKHLVEPARPLSAVGSTSALPMASAPGLPWGLLLMGIALVAAIVFFIRAMNRPRVLPAAAGGYGGGQFGNPQPYGPAGMGPVAGGGMGSGILGGLATGAAVGAGMVAGEALMHRVLGGGNAANVAPVESIADTPISPAADYDMGGNDFGISDAGSWDDGSIGGSGDWN